MRISDHNIVVFDLETKTEIGIAGCPGWTDYDKMGISVGCSFNFKTQDFKVYFDDGLEELYEELQNADLVSGFNITGFDIPLIGAQILLKKPNETLLPIRRVYDPLFYSRKAVGYKQGGSFPKGLKLDNHLDGTFGKAHMKTGDGANAPKLFQEGKISQLTSYCLADVKREAMLFRHIWDHGYVRTPEHGLKELVRPQTLLETK